MATITAVENDTVSFTKHYFWETLTESDTATAMNEPFHSDRTIQVFGDFGTGGTVIVEGSLEITPTTYFPLTDQAGNAISFTAAGGALIAENVLHVRPRVSAGTSVDVDVTIIGRRTL